jgi:hypothetical protein
MCPWRQSGGSASRGTAALLAASGLLLLSAPSASARWTIHNDADVTNIAAPPGGVDGETCADRIRGQAGWAVGESPDVYVPPALAYQAVQYDIWTKPATAPTGGDIQLAPNGQDVVYVQPDSTSVPAAFVKHFTTSRRHAVTPPYLIPDFGGLYLYTVGTFYTSLPQSIAAGDPVGIKPTATGSDFLTLTTIDCARAVVRVDVRPGVTPNTVNPRQPTPLLPVLVYGSATLDVRSIAAVHLKNAESRAVAAELRRPFDADGDGFLDKTYYFSPKATGIRCGQGSVTLAGRTSLGLRFGGTDSIHPMCN